MKAIIEPDKCRSGPPFEFMVDARACGKAPLEVLVSTKDGPIAHKPEIEDKDDGTYKVSFIPPREGETCNVQVNYGGKPIQGR